jgi:hypothetical protein
MNQKRVWVIINISLSLIAILLILNLFNVTLPVLGKPVERLADNSLCVMKNWENEYITRNIDDCCLEKIKFAPKCYRTNIILKENTFSYVCGTGNKIEYYFNNNGLKYCRRLW